jgi:hypothetical protein
MQETLHNIDGCSLNKTELDVLYFMSQGSHSFRWNAVELSLNTGYSINDVDTACDMLKLHGLVESTEDDDGYYVHIPAPATDWLTENSDELYALTLMNDASQFSDSETATA